ncbi:hypothetical protein Tco_0302743 [Tanacetum coccineum]
MRIQISPTCNYMFIFGTKGYNQIYRSVRLAGEWMEMPETRLVIASTYNKVVVSLSNDEGCATSFPLWSDPPQSDSNETALMLHSDQWKDEQQIFKRLVGFPSTLKTPSKETFKDVRAFSNCSSWSSYNEGFKSGSDASAANKVEMIAAYKINNERQQLLLDIMDITTRLVMPKLVFSAAIDLMDSRNIDGANGTLSLKGKSIDRNIDDHCHNNDAKFKGFTSCLEYELYWSDEVQLDKLSTAAFEFLILPELSDKAVCTASFVRYRTVLVFD